MIKIALLLSDNLLPDAENTRPDREELVEQMGKLTPAFALQGLELVEVRWREIAERAAEFAAILPLMVWDYFEGRFGRTRRARHSDINGRTGHRSKCRASL